MSKVNENQDRNNEGSVFDKLFESFGNISENLEEIGKKLDDGVQ